MHEDLQKIKKKYGENMMHLCRELFPTILEKKGVLFKILSDNYAYSKFLYDDIINNKLKDSFKNYIYSLYGVKEKYNDSEKSVKELLDEAGYKFYECHSEEDIQAFKKYYVDGEVICTFNEKRLDNCYVFFAVKKNVDDVKREKMVNPKREDEYGTSVLSIQFSKGKTNTLSIKNRYNHSVKNPDATFSNNLDNIKRGLTKAFEKEYGLNIDYNKDELEIPGYVKANDGKYYKYNYEINNIYYCPGNIIIDKLNAKEYDKSNKIVLDYYILDLKDKSIKIYDKRIKDSLIEYFDNIEKIEVKLDKENNKKCISFDNNVDIVVDKYNIIVEYNDKEIKTIGNNFMKDNIFLKKINLPKVESIGDSFLSDNKYLEQVCLDNLKTVGTNCFEDNISLKQLRLPKIEKVGGYLLYFNRYLNDFYAPNLEYVDSGFLSNNIGLRRLDLPKLKNIESSFLSQNVELDQINLPSVEFISVNFLARNMSLKSIDFPNLKTICSNFIWSNESISEVNLPKIETISDNFLLYNKNVTHIDMPYLKRVGKNFMYDNILLEEAKLNKLTYIEEHFLHQNKNLERLSLPNCRIISNYFIPKNTKLKEIELPNLEFAGCYFLDKNEMFNTDNFVKTK